MSNSKLPREADGIGGADFAERLTLLHDDAVHLLRLDDSEIELDGKTIKELIWLVHFTNNPKLTDLQRFLLHVADEAASEAKINEGNEYE